MKTTDEYFPRHIQYFVYKKEGLGPVKIQRISNRKTLGSIQYERASDQKNDYISSGKRRMELIVKSILGFIVFIGYMWVTMWIILNH